MAKIKTKFTCVFGCSCTSFTKVVIMLRILANVAFRILPSLLVLISGSVLAVAIDRGGSTSLGAFVLAAHAICAFHTIYIGLISAAGSK